MKNCPSNSIDKSKKFQENFLLNKESYPRNYFHPVAMLTLDQVDKAISKISNNTAAGHDNICIEHFKFAHPSVLVILKSIFNIFISIGEVPLDFGLGLVTPIPKFKGHKNSVNADDFRGITLNVIASKIFEHCIYSFFDNIHTSERQFGFKKNLGCNHALHQVSNTINFFTSKRNTVNLGFVDVSKAFDKANFWGILQVLQKKCVNPHIINVMEHWFSIGTARVRWSDALSDPVPLTAGVRQGSVLSPLLFSAYVDVVLIELDKSRLG